MTRNFAQYNNRPYLLRPGLRSEFSQRKGGLIGGLIYEYWRNRALAEEYPFLEGHSHLLSPYTGYNFTDTFFASLNYSLYQYASGEEEWDNGTNRLPTAYFGHGPILKTTWRVSSKWSIHANFEYSLRKFRATYLPENKERTDKVTQFQLRATFHHTQKLNFYLQATQQIRHSTMDETTVENGNWDSMMTYGGLFWEAF